MGEIPSAKGIESFQQEIESQHLGPFDPNCLEPLQLDPKIKDAYGGYEEIVSAYYDHYTGLINREAREIRKRGAVKQYGLSPDALKVIVNHACDDLIDIVLPERAPVFVTPRPRQSSE